MTDTRTYIMEARKSKKGKTGKDDSAKRSRFLSAIMSQLAGDNGKAMADAIEAKNLDKFKELWNKASSNIFSSLEKKFKEGKNE